MLWILNHALIDVYYIQVYTELWGRFTFIHCSWPGLGECTSQLYGPDLSYAIYKFKLYTFFPLGKICFQNSSSRHDVTQRQHCGLAKYVFKKGGGGVGHDIIKSPCKDIIYIQIYKLLAMTIRVLTRCVEANRLRLVITEPIHGNRVRIIGIIITLHFIHKK